MGRLLGFALLGMPSNAVIPAAAGQPGYIDLGGVGADIVLKLLAFSACSWREK